MSRGSATLEAIFCGLLFAGLIFTASVAARRSIEWTKSFAQAQRSTQQELINAATPCLEKVDVAGVSKDILGREIKVTLEPLCK